MIKTFTFIIATLIVVPAVAKQKFYKWTDEHGVTHYTAEKPANNPTDEVNVSTNQPVVNRQAKTVQTADPEAKSYLEQRREKKQKADELAKQNRSHCLAAKKAMTKYQQPVRMSRVDSQTGETLYLDDAKRAEIIKNAQKDVRKYCK